MGSNRPPSKISPKTLFIACIILPFLLMIFLLIGGIYSVNPASDKVVQTTPINWNGAKQVIRKGNNIIVIYKDNSEKTYQAPQNTSLNQLGLDLENVEVRIENERDNAGSAKNTLLSFIPVVAIIVVSGLQFAFWLIMLNHALKVNKQNKQSWILFILFTFNIGAFIYFLKIYRRA